MRGYKDPDGLAGEVLRLAGFNSDPQRRGGGKREEKQCWQNGKWMMPGIHSVTHHFLSVRGVPDLPILRKRAAVFNKNLQMGCVIAEKLSSTAAEAAPTAALSQRAWRRRL